MYIYYINKCDKWQSLTFDINEQTLFHIFIICKLEFVTLQNIV